MNTQLQTNEPAEYMGVRFRIEAQAAPQGGTYIGHYTLLPALGVGDGAAAEPPFSGVDDIAHPSMDSRWGTENEALSYATQAAHSAIELLLDGRTQGHGNRSNAAERRLTGD